ncbi:hypothetical protein [Niabella ginsengisoli]|uniref:DUF445 family protein n=1 Tax=Niabella ginsengisoli TaxID=522298 RepID=A0ABS9SK97_9BACT|nr:hypothetical protein [Niabella ginsengisoli]MCH5598716.1 hypothetical protein [Niabella ginsengisoli]
MNPWMFSIPLISALIGWLFNILAGRYLLYNYLPKKKDQLSATLGSKIESVLPFSKLEEQIGNPELVEKAMPMIETHIDEFLSVKLPQEIPMLAMFVGNKTTDKIKEVFINQLRALFPKVMTTILSNLKEKINISKTIQAEIDKTDITVILKENLSGTMQRFGYTGLLLGFIIGAVNLLLFYAIQ